MSICPRCAAAFGCGVDEATCWCHEVTVPPQVLTDLRASFEACLCPACLREAVASVEDATKNGA